MATIAVDAVLMVDPIVDDEDARAAAHETEHAAQ